MIKINKTNNGYYINDKFILLENIAFHHCGDKFTCQELKYFENYLKAERDGIHRCKKEK